jgi:hypothetical protein
VVGEVDGCVDAALAAHPIATHLEAVGFMRSAGGYLWPKDAAMIGVRRVAVAQKTDAPVVDLDISDDDDGDDADDGSAPWDVDEEA